MKKKKQGVPAAVKKQSFKAYMKGHYDLYLLLLPAIFDVNGIWISIVVAEFLAVSVTATLIIKNRKKYQYA